MEKIVEEFGLDVFDDKKMKELLPSPVYKRWIDTMNNKGALDRETADVIAHEMKTWALSKGCTHYTHWFQPLTGATAEKHDSFLDMDKEGKPLAKFSGKNLIKGEPDASSFPSGGLRATFEARGYTYWDCTSPAFIKDGTLFIPTIFVSYKGEALDFKGPLLKSMDSVSKASCRVINAFGDKSVTRVTSSVGLEQEYFLVAKEDFLKREDLVLAGKTVIGALPPKGQELETHYFGTIPTRVQDFMKDVNVHLWKLGIFAKTEHNEVAPGQFELAPIYADTNIAIDQNQIIMEVLQKTALKHDLVCLLHEKPFAGINGSGKHNNWSLTTNTGVNLFDPGKNPHENIQFLTFLCAFIKAVDTHPELIRLFTSCPGNDYRLGANEAPPAIISIFLGSVIEDVLDSLVDDKPKTYAKNSLKDFGISNLSYLPRDNADRNRTSPVAFTGNKFEVRALGSSMSAGYLNVALNSIMAEALNEIADEIESHKYRQDIRKAALDICVEIVKEHKRILFGGDGYANAWIDEAEKRGLLNIRTWVETIKYVEEHNSAAVLVKEGALSEEEVSARLDVMYETYAKVKSIELRTLSDMMKTKVYPVIGKNIVSLASTGEFMPEYFKETIVKLKAFVDESSKELSELDKVIADAHNLTSNKETGLYLLEKGVPLHESIRAKYDAIEGLLASELFTYPTYGSLFFKLDY